MKNHSELKHIISAEGFRTIAYYYAGIQENNDLN